MLPGFRFLFTAIVLSLSILVFGLGAAALLRAAHEEFASNPSWHAPPETMFAQQVETAAPALAMLQIEAPAAAQKAPDDAADIAAATEPAEIVKESSVPEVPKSEIPASESPAQSEATSAQADDTTQIRAPDAETRIASSEQVSPPQILSPVSETAPVAAEPAAPTQASTQAPPEVDAIAAKIAALGGPHVTIKPPPAAASKKIDDSIKKRLQAKKAAQRRRLAARARLAAQQAQQVDLTPPAQQQTFGPFGQPSAPPPAAARR